MEQTQPVPADPVAARPEDVIVVWSAEDLEAAPEVVAGYRELAGMLLGQRSLASTLTRIATLTRDLVEGADDVSITLIRARRSRTVAFAGDSDLAYLLDERQYTDGFGPCVDAAEAGTTIAIDTANSRNYPGFAALARSQGVQHTLAVGFSSVDDTSGALNIYSRCDGGFTERAEKTAHGFSSYAAVAITNAALYADAIEEAAQLNEAMRSRAAIEQAKGMIMQSHRCGPNEAFRILRDVSMQSNRKLHDIAVHITGRFAGADPGEPQ